MRVTLEPCIILHRRAYRDTSLLLDVFSQTHGRLGLVARGAKRPKARWRGVLEPLRLLRLSWSGRGELRTLTEAEPQHQSRALSGDYLYGAFYAAELILRTTAQHDPHPLLFEQFLQLLASLAQLSSPSPMAPKLRRFERDLLAELGYGLLLDVETNSGKPVRANAQYLYHPEHGVRASDARPQTVEVAISGEALLALANDNIQPGEHAKAQQRLLAAALAPHLGDKPLRSAQTLRALKRLQQPANIKD